MIIRLTMLQINKRNDGLHWKPQGLPTGQLSKGVSPAAGWPWGVPRVKVGTGVRRGQVTSDSRAAGGMHCHLPGPEQTCVLKDKASLRRRDLLSISPKWPLFYLEDSQLS